MHKVYWSRQVNIMITFGVFGNQWNASIIEWFDILLSKPSKYGSNYVSIM